MYGGTLRFALDCEPNCFDPSGVNTLSDLHVMSTLYDTLLEIDHQLNVQPGLVESWEILSPARYKMKLRAGVLFQDGTPLTTAHIRWTFQYYQREDSILRETVQLIEEVEVLDEFTFVLKLTRPHAPFLSQLASTTGMILSSNTVAVENETGETLHLFVGTGPFVPIKKTARAFCLQRNPSYWDVNESGQPLPYAQYIELPWLENGTEMLNALESGELSFINEVPYAKVPALAQREDLQFVGIASHSYNGIRLQVTTFPFSEKPLRQAVAASIDREWMLEKVNLGVGYVSHGPIAPASWAFDEEFRPYKPDRDRIQTLLLAGGCPTGFEFTIKIPPGPIARMVTCIKEQLAEQGITMHLEVVEFPELVESLVSQNYQAMFLGFAGGTDPHSLLFETFHSRGGENYTGYSNPHVDALLEEACLVTDQAQRIALYRHAQQIVVEDSPFVFTRSGLSMIAKRSNIHQIEPHPDTLIRWKKIWIQEESVSR
ncbi:ABC transporter substrate-binding protein [Tumebacillus permanentifrigoris]|uniref:Peptide/nickel transport system substrate-binding protein n=1 Tax=Tumebacillus permanentifrigoris TaxID=378543 RepID=A0A316D5Q3_9BACL|nr:ABC transporter substrate-binding protein [Tumebacillus permanentifrigoris]PWK09590.1 peptide/nickel transport system substrate-binding protein [Tumebacillus permanentifrigoris]